MTIAQQLKIKEFPFEIKDSDGNQIYWENSNGYWEKREYDSEGNRIYYEDSNGYWSKHEYDPNGNVIYYENFTGYWFKRECDKLERELAEAKENIEMLEIRHGATMLCHQAQMDEITKQL
jgi:hypothetical protein